MHPLPCPAPLRALVALLKTCLCLAILLSGLGTRPAGAQENFPGGKPVTILVPFASGGSPDLLARHLATSLGKLWNSPVVVENRPGAGGNIAAGAVARAAPDGHTLLMGTDGPLAINPSLYAAMPYDPIRDFEPIGMVATVDFVLVTAPELGKPDLRRFIALAGQHNPPMAYGSSGVGSQHHLGMETFRMQEGIELRHVPYRGVAPALADVMGNHVPVMFAAIPSAAPLIQSGKVHAVAVTSSQRSAMLPGVPTMREAGVETFELRAWFGLVAPAQTPASLVTRLNADLNHVLSQADVQAAMQANGFTITRSSPQAFSRLIATEQHRWADAAKLAGVTAQ